MCLIIHSPPQTTIPKDLIETAFSHNHDGWGVMAHTENGIYTKKGFKLRKLKREVQKLNELNTEVLVHLRFATHGNIDLQNCHPFPIGKRSYMMHNGVLTHVRTHTKPTMSDTWHFAKLATRIFPYLDDVIDDPEFIYDMENYTDGSRVAILRDDGKVVLYNKEDWTEREDGLWVSNTWSCQVKWKDSVYDWDDYDEQWSHKTRTYKDSDGTIWPKKGEGHWIYKDDDEGVYAEWHRPTLDDDEHRPATAEELSLFAVYAMQPDRLLNWSAGRQDGSKIPSKLTSEIELEIIERIEMWGGPQYAPWGLDQVAHTVWKAWMIDEDVKDEKYIKDIAELIAEAQQNEVEKALVAVEGESQNNNKTE